MAIKTTMVTGSIFLSLLWAGLVCSTLVRQRRESFNFNNLPSLSDDNSDPTGPPPAQGDNPTDLPGADSGKKTFSFGGSTRWNQGTEVNQTAAAENRTFNFGNGQSGWDSAEPVGKSFNFGSNTGQPFEDAGLNVNSSGSSVAEFGSNASPSNTTEDDVVNFPGLGTNSAGIPAPGGDSADDGDDNGQASENVHFDFNFPPIHDANKDNGAMLDGPDEGNPSNMSFNFNNGNGNTNWDDGADVSMVTESWGSLPSLDLPPLDSPQGSEIGAAGGKADCGIDFCTTFDPCDLEDVKVAEACNIVCAENASSTLSCNGTAPFTGNQSEGLALRPEAERMCNNDRLFMCKHGVCEFNTTCLCDPGWTGDFCQVPCTLPCEHGSCEMAYKASGNYTDEDMTCSCQHEWTGDLCHEIKPDPEELARILTGSLCAALAVVLVVMVVLPLVLWRMRVIFIMKLVYFFKEYEDDDGKLYDAYISMTPTSEAEMYVYSTLAPKLEEMGFQIYLQARDQEVGQAISENIVWAVEQSRRTILIVTSDYVRSQEHEWNRFEYLLAQHEMLKLKQRIIPIVLGDISQERDKMDKSLKHILDCIKCLRYPKSTTATTPSSASPSESPSLSSDSRGIMNNNLKREKVERKFWKRLELTMPKTKKHDAKMSSTSKSKTGQFFKNIFSHTQHDTAKTEKFDAAHPKNQLKFKKERKTLNILELTNKKGYVHDTFDIDKNFLALNITALSQFENLKDEPKVTEGSDTVIFPANRQVDSQDVNLDIDL